jgi:hypothetical protein
MFMEMEPADPTAIEMSPSQEKICKVSGFARIAQEERSDTK